MGILGDTPDAAQVMLNARGAPPCPGGAARPRFGRYDGLWRPVVVLLTLGVSDHLHQDLAGIGGERSDDGRGRGVRRRSGSALRPTVAVGSRGSWHKI